MAVTRLNVEVKDLIVEIEEKLNAINMAAIDAYSNSSTPQNKDKCELLKRIAADRLLINEHDGFIQTYSEKAISKTLDNILRSIHASGERPDYAEQIKEDIHVKAFIELSKKRTLLSQLQAQLDILEKLVNTYEAELAEKDKELTADVDAIEEQIELTKQGLASFEDLKADYTEFYVKTKVLIEHLGKSSDVREEVEQQVSFIKATIKDLMEEQEREAIADQSVLEKQISKVKTVFEEIQEYVGSKSKTDENTDTSIEETGAILSKIQLFAPVAQNDLNKVPAELSADKDKLLEKAIQKQEEVKRDFYACGYQLQPKQKPIVVPSLKRVVRFADAPVEISGDKGKDKEKDKEKEQEYIAESSVGEKNATSETPVSNPAQVSTVESIESSSSAVNPANEELIIISVPLKSETFFRRNAGNILGGTIGTASGLFGFLGGAGLGAVAGAAIGAPLAPATFGGSVVLGAIIGAIIGASTLGTTFGALFGGLGGKYGKDLGDSISKGTYNGKGKTAPLISAEELMAAPNVSNSHVTVSKVIGKQQPKPLAKAKQSAALISEEDLLDAPELDFDAPELGSANDFEQTYQRMGSTRS